MKLTKLVRPLKNIPIFILILISYIVIILIIVVGFTVISFQNATKVSEDKTYSYTGKMMDNTNQQLTSRIQSAIDTSFALSNDEQLKRLLNNFKKASVYDQIEYESKIKEVIENYWRFQPQVVNITVFVESKNYVSDAHNSLCSIEEVSNEYWFKALGNRPGLLIDTHSIKYIRDFGSKHLTTLLVKVSNISDIYVDQKMDFEFDKNNVKYNTEVDNEYYSNISAGVIATDISEEYFFDMLNKGKASPNSDIMLISKSGKIISCADKSKIGSTINSDKNSNTVFTSLSKEGGSRNINIGKEKYLLIYTQPSDLGWRIVQLIPHAELDIGASRILRTVAVLAFLLILIVLPISVVLSRLISNPLVKLAQTMKCIKTGGMNKIDENAYGNEIGDLYKSYNYMMDKIEILLEDIKRVSEVQRQTDIKALQAQINPHFLYNTLDSINWMALENGMSDISKMVTMLSRLFRLSLNKGKSIYTLKEETEQVAYYLEIQKIRFSDRFRYNISVDESILEYFVPKLILQPLAENSIIHGFNQMLSGGIISISISTKDTKMYIDLIDNGSGISKEKAKDIISFDSQCGGYGIKNVHQRIQFICGKDYGLEYFTENIMGTFVRITLPITKNPDIFRQE